MQSKEKNYRKRFFFKEKVEWRTEQKRKEGLVTALTSVIKKHANELKVHRKILRIAITQDFSPNLNPLIMLYEAFKKTKQMRLPIKILVHLTATDENWNKMTEEFLLNVCKSLRRRVDALIKKIVSILSIFVI